MRNKKCSEFGAEIKCSPGDAVVTACGSLNGRYGVLMILPKISERESFFSRASRVRLMAIINKLYRR